MGGVLLRNAVLCMFMLSAVTASFADEILRGAGATFPYPLYKKLFEIFQNKTGTRIVYTPSGSGDGIRRVLEKSVDFGGTDAFLSDSEQTEGDDILHVPTCLGAVALTYNLPGSPTLRFTPRLIEEIFLGKITRWSDSRIAKLNPHVTLPDLDIAIIHRSESSGTTFIFTDYLSKVGREWAERIGCGKLVRWPAGMGVEGNPGVVQFVKKISGSIGYVELYYAQQHGLPCAALRNRTGQFINPTLGSVSIAGNVELPADARLLITDTPVSDAYPISAFTYVILHREQAHNNARKEKARAMANLLIWMVNAGQRHAQDLGYAPLPPRAVKRANSIIQKMTFNGKPVL